MPDHVVLNTDRVVEVFTSLSAMYGNQHPFIDLVPPEKQHFPVGVTPGSRQDANFRGAASWLQRNGRLGEQLIVDAAHLAETQPWVIDPLHPDSNDIANFNDLKHVIPYGNTEKEYRKIEWWFDLLSTLRNDYDGDWRNLFLTIDYTGDRMIDRDLILKRLTAFKGIGVKIASMISVFFQDNDWDSHQDKWAYIRTIPMLPVDMWWLRLAKQYGFVESFTLDTQRVIDKELARKFAQICVDHNIDNIALCQVMWLLGAYICGKRPYVEQKAARYCASCPGRQFCQGKVPSNYDKKRLKTSPSGRLGSMQWARMFPHPEIIGKFTPLPIVIKRTKMIPILVKIAADEAAAMVA